MTDIELFYWIIYKGDIAEGEFSRHSDNLQKEKEKYSFLATDGDPMTCSYTAEFDSNYKRVNPFWQVWFPTNKTIRELQIVTSTEKMNYFKNFTVFVEYLSPAKMKEILYKPTYSRECYKHESDGLNNVSIIVLCNRPEVGNQVTIELGEYRTQLVLCDVRIKRGHPLLPPVNFTVIDHLNKSSGPDYIMLHPRRPQKFPSFQGWARDLQQLFDFMKMGKTLPITSGVERDQAWFSDVPSRNITH